MFLLVLHTAPEPFGETIGHDSVPCGCELRCDEIWLILIKEFFGLVRWRNDQCAEESRDEYGGYYDFEWVEGEEEGIMCYEGPCFRLGSFPFRFKCGDDGFNGVESPECE